MGVAVRMFAPLLLGAALLLPGLSLAAHPRAHVASRCVLTAHRPRYVRPNDIVARASLRCAGAEKNASLRVALVHIGRAVPARQTLPVPDVAANRSYTATAQTRCVVGAYATRASARIGDATIHATTFGQPRLILCDNRCDVVAKPPTLSTDVIVAPASFTCVSDQKDLLWTVTLQNYDNGSWQYDGRHQPSRAATYRYGKTYDEEERQPCANEAATGPEQFRTVMEVRRARGPLLRQISRSATLTCPGAGLDLDVHLTGSGSGTVTSSPAGISCPGTCSSKFPEGTHVTLTATPAAGSVFLGWTGPTGPRDPTCSGTGACTVDMDAPKNVVADFEPQHG